MNANEKSGYISTDELMQSRIIIIIIISGHVTRAYIRVWQLQAMHTAAPLLLNINTIQNELFNVHPPKGAMQERQLQHHELAVFASMDGQFGLHAGGHIESATRIEGLIQMANLQY